MGGRKQKMVVCPRCGTWYDVNGITGSICYNCGRRYH